MKQKRLLDHISYEVYLLTVFILRFSSIFPFSLAYNLCKTLLNPIARLRWKLYDKK